jgi:sporulation protein YlmC with PRC-barrel domain
MRLSDLLGTPVVDEQGRAFGHIQDVRLIQDGPLLDGFGAALAIEGLVVGKRQFGERLGFHRSNMRGPLLVKRFFEWVHRDARYVPWERVASVGQDRVRVAGSCEDLERPEPISE